MKNLTLCLVAALTLVACAKDGDKAVEAASAISSSQPEERPVTLSYDPANPYANVDTQKNNACPLLDGKYVRREHKNEDGSITPRKSIKLETRMDGDHFSYAFDGKMSLQLADGETRASNVPNTASKGEIRVSCDETSVEFAGQEEGKEAFTIKITKRGDVDSDGNANRINVEATGEAASLSGKYTRQ